MRLFYAPAVIPGDYLVVEEEDDECGIALQLLPGRSTVYGIWTRRTAGGAEAGWLNRRKEWPLASRVTAVVTILGNGCRHHEPSESLQGGGAIDPGRFLDAGPAGP